MTEPARHLPDASSIDLMANRSQVKLELSRTPTFWIYFHNPIEIYQKTGWMDGQMDWYSIAWKISTQMIHMPEIL